MSSSEFCSRSIRLNSDLSTEYRKANGVYFTPLSARRRVFQKLAEFGVAAPSTVLEPSFGSGEFLDDLKTVYPDATVHGVEFSKEIYDAYPASETLVNQDFLEYAAAPVDLIIGNPPYVVTTLKNPECQKGRGNLFVLFIYKCLTEHMADGSVLAFVLPTSFYNCSYYEPCRQYISKNCTVLHVETIDAKYYETGQKTMILILRKETPRNQNFLLSLGDSVYITPDYADLQECIRGASTLRNLGFSVKTGEVVWNQEKDKLTNEARGGAERIIYTSNIGEDCTLTFAPLKGEKKQYIRGFQKETVCGPAIVVSRGYGNNYSFRWAFIPADTRFYGENHVNVITGPPEGIDRVVASFRSERTQAFIQMFVGNGALSKTELETIFPIF